jgi:hypothetical protein
MVGAVAGSPGTLPTNWSFSGTSGLTQTIVGTGTENGLSYLDLRLNGTASASSVRFSTDTNTAIAALPAQIWSNSSYFKLTAGVLPYITLRNVYRNSAGGAISTPNQQFDLTSTLTRRVFTDVGAPALTAFVQQEVLAILVIGTAYDFTIRIAAPQMELGAYATTFIPTTTAAVTRLADAALKTGVSSLIGQTEGTLFVEFSTANLESYTRRIFSLSDGAGANQINLQIQASTTTLTFAVLNGGAAQAVINTSTNFYTLGSTIKIAVAYKANDFAFYANGTQIGVDTLGTVPTCSQFRFADPLNSNIFVGGISQYALFPTRLTNAQLAQLTA